MKRFRMKSIFFEESKASEFNEDNPPSWLLHKEFKWWYDGHVLALKIGESIESDFQKFTRIA